MPEAKSNIWSNESLASYFVRWIDKNVDQKKLKQIRHIILKKKNNGGTLESLLSKEFPELKWTSSLSTFYIKKSQYLLKECLREMFPSEGKYL
jgi:hypothetical protein